MYFFKYILYEYESYYVYVTCAYFYWYTHFENMKWDCDDYNNNVIIYILF